MSCSRHRIGTECSLCIITKQWEEFGKHVEPIDSSGSECSVMWTKLCASCGWGAVKKRRAKKSSQEWIMYVWMEELLWKYVCTHTLLPTDALLLNVCWRVTIQRQCIHIFTSPQDCTSVDTLRHRREIPLKACTHVHYEVDWKSIKAKTKWWSPILLLPFVCWYTNVGLSSSSRMKQVPAEFWRNCCYNKRKRSFPLCIQDSACCNTQRESMMKANILAMMTHKVNNSFHKCWRRPNKTWDSAVQPGEGQPFVKESLWKFVSQPP